MTGGRQRALQLSNVEFSYTEDALVLNGIDLDIEAGEFITIIGQNGSGKSTLVKQFNGLLTPDQGSVTVHGPDGTPYATSDEPLKRLAQYVGYVFQNPDDQIFHTSVYEEIAYGLKNIGVPEEDVPARIETVLDQVGLDTDGGQNPFNLGKGQRQRLAIASVLAMEPQIICVDEPTTGQDRTESQRILEILQQYNERGHTVVVITHDIALAAAYTDRVIVVNDGTIAADGPPKEVFRKREHLEQTNIRPPQITQLGIALKERTDHHGLLDELWLTVQDAIDDMKPLETRQENPPQSDEDAQLPNKSDVKASDNL
ncbi:energy-coupling factor ABC transporter ATP-binding protein [Salinigranum halophilum]|uniref:energy-coupling factor ABC transporter ATP-binding protein n=1 Tax=Salinigranum halophilum TaxID=2565931 RepID=UPI0010A751DC|nr:ABC transporter ATP-binding protein [Salinigranum halophilum]